MVSPVPVEILDQILSELSPADLRNARLVCHSYALLAARHLFCEVFVWHNQESLQNVDQILSHSVFGHHVRNVVYSEVSLPHPQYEDFDTWFGNLDHINKKLENLEDYYKAYILRTQYDKRLRADGTLKSRIFGKLALMTNTLNVYVNPDTRSGGEDRASISRVTRETLCRPNYWVGSDGRYPEPCMDILHSLFGSRSQIKLLEGHQLKSAGFDDPWSQLDRIGRHLRHLTLRFQPNQPPLRICNLAKIQQILEEGLMLETLELMFSLNWSGYPFILFGQIWAKEVHYRSLKRLKLSGVRTPQSRLMDFLTRHAPSLRSLELCDIDFEWKEAWDETCAGSWTDMIHFLEQHLNLTSVSLSGIFTNRWDEGWISGSRERRHHVFHHMMLEGKLIYGASKHKPVTELLKYRIEQYILKGGVCPLDMPPGRNDKDLWRYWNEIGDYSWHLCGDDLHPLFIEIYL